MATCLDAQQGWVDQEVAALIKDSICLRRSLQGLQILLHGHAPSKINGVQLEHIRVSPLQVVCRLQGLIIDPCQLASAERKHPDTPAWQLMLKEACLRAEGLQWHNDAVLAGAQCCDPSAKSNMLMLSRSVADRSAVPFDLATDQ